MVSRIVLIRPCCIGDVVVATPTLSALRRAYPDAHITWAVGSWSRKAIENHPAIDAILDTGGAAMPVRSVGGFIRFVRQLRSGNFDLAVSLVRSPLMSMAVWFSGIPQRAGIDSAGRGFGYNIRATIDPAEVRHESEIYLHVVRELGIETGGLYANLPVTEAARQAIRNQLQERGIQKPYLVIHPAGGANPGMTMHHKRWPPQNMAQIADWLADELGVSLILLGGPHDNPIIEAVREHLRNEAYAFIGELDLQEIAPLASEAALYIGNDTGLTHIAAASGAKTIMILGPSDPRRYAPYTANSLALWKPIPLSAGGVAFDRSQDWDWQRDGISVEEAKMKIREFLERDVESRKNG